MKRYLLALSTLISIQSALATPMHIGSGDVCRVKALNKIKGNSACVCEVMKKEEWNKNEYAFYKIGCGKWLNSQSCDQKIIVDTKDNIEGFLSSIPNLSHVKVGYVGHWASAEGTVEYLKDRIIPIANNYDVPVFYDNTACQGASNPLLIRNFINSQPEHLQNKIIVKANQNISVGEWDSILKPILTSNTEITMCSKGLEIPNCSDFNRRNCSISINGGDTSGCIDKNNQFKVYKCTDVKENRSGRFELGKWREVDMRSRGSQIIETTISDINPTDFAYVTGTKTITNKELLEEYGYENDSLEITDSKLLMIDYQTYHNQEAMAVQEKLREMFGRFSYISDRPEHLSVSLYKAQKSPLTLEDAPVYILIDQNSNIPMRVSRDRSKLEFFQKSKNPIMNYYHMYADELETAIPVRFIESFLNR